MCFYGIDLGTTNISTDLDQWSCSTLCTLENLLLMTWTLVEAVLPTLGWQEYRPESLRLDCCTRRKEEVVEPDDILHFTSWNFYEISFSNKGLTCWALNLIAFQTRSEQKSFSRLISVPLNPASTSDFHFYSRLNQEIPH